MYIFWDNSNIHYAGLDHVFPFKEPSVQRELYRTHFSNLLDLVANKRAIDDIFFAGSVPPKGDSLWKHIQSIGITPSLLPRSLTDGEADTTDHVLQLALLRLVWDNPEPNTIALLTGDGAGINNGQGFLADAKRIAEKGWKFEVYSWDSACHGLLKKFAEENGKYVNLEDYYENITFIKGGRRAKPL